MAAARSRMSSHPTQRYAFFDEWRENKLTKRGHYFTAAGGVMGRTGFAPFLKRPEWTTTSGTPSASGGVLVNDAAESEEVSIPTTFDVGVWEVKFQNQATPTNGTIWVFNILETVASNFWGAHNIIGIRYGFSKRVATVDSVVITDTTITDTAWHTVKITRTSAGGWELFKDGVSVGTTTDTWLPPTPWYLNIRKENVYNATVWWDDLKVY